MVQYHDGPLGGHLGAEKVHERLREKYWWPQMLKVIKEYVRLCANCQARRPPGEKYGLLQPIPFGAQRPWSFVQMDFGSGIPESESGNKAILVFVDCVSKEVELEATKDQEAKTVARGFVERVIYRHGCPETLLSDRASDFRAKLTSEIAKLADVKTEFSVAYHRTARWRTRCVRSGSCSRRSSASTSATGTGNFAR